MFTSSDFATLRTVIAIVAVAYFVFRFARSSNTRTGTRHSANINPSNEDMLQYGATLVKDGHAYFPDWSAMMLREYDDLTDAKLERFFEFANTVAESPETEWHQRIREQLVE